MPHTNGNTPNPNLDLLDAEDVGLSRSADDKSEAASEHSEATTEKMAQWMGMAQTTEETSTDFAADTPELDEQEDDDEMDSTKVDESGKTKTPLCSNPLMKLGFVGGVALACLVFVGMVVNTIQNAGRRDLSSTPTAQKVEEEEPEDPMQAALREQEEEIGNLKTRNALGNQQLAMEMQEGDSSDMSAAELLAIRSQLERRRAQTEGETPQPEVTTQRVSPPPRVTAPRPSPAPRSAPPPPPPPRSEPVSRSTPPEPEVSPELQLSQLNRYGSYGSGSALPANTIAAAPIAPAAIPSATAQVEPIETTPAFSTDTASSPEVSAIPSFNASPKQEAVTYAEEEAAILGHTLVTVQSGTYAPATLETPIYWAQDLANEEQSQRTALKLSEPLYGSRGEVALEAGTLLVAEVNVIAGSGLLQLHVTDVVVTKDGRQQVMSVPNQNLVIAGSEGQPLIAREIQNTGEIRAAQVQLAALGALGNVGELLNRPESSQSTVGIGGSFVSVENGPVNILAGLLEGAADAVLPIEQSRVEDRIDDYENQPRIWYHGSDAPVMLFVAEEFTFQAD